jgi:hypothetical protein
MILLYRADAQMQRRFHRQPNKAPPSACVPTPRARRAASVAQLLADVHLATRRVTCSCRDGSLLRPVRRGVRLVASARSEPPGEARKCGARPSTC